MVQNQDFFSFMPYLEVISKRPKCNNQKTESA